MFIDIVSLRVAIVNRMDATKNLTHRHTLRERERERERERIIFNH